MSPLPYDIARCAGTQNEAGTAMHATCLGCRMRVAGRPGGAQSYIAPPIDAASETCHRRIAYPTWSISGYTMLPKG